VLVAVSNSSEAFLPQNYPLMAVYMCVMSVVVQSNGGIPPLDVETILFLEDKVVLGKVSSVTVFLHSSHIAV